MGLEHTASFSVEDLQHPVLLVLQCSPLLQQLNAHLMVEPVQACCHSDQVCCTVRQVDLLCSSLLVGDVARGGLQGLVQLLLAGVGGQHPALCARWTSASGHALGALCAHAP